jgi:hypothetical protein
MASPTLEKTWQISPNNIVYKGVEHTVNRQLMFAIKEILTGFASNPWTVHSSSDGVTNFGAADYWNTWEDLLWGTGNHSWIIFNHPCGAQIKFDQKYANTQCEDMWVCFSPGALYTGGSLSAAPTATDEETDLLVEERYNTTGQKWWTGFLDTVEAVKWNVRFHVWHSADGLVTRVGLWTDGECIAFWQFGDLSDPRAGHTDPFCMGGLATLRHYRDCMSVASLQGNGFLFTIIDGTRCRLNHLGLFTGRALAGIWSKTYAGTSFEQTDDEVPITEVAYMCDTAGALGMKGHASDLWWGPYQVVMNGHTSPDDATARDFVYIKGLCFPWTGDATPCHILA